MLIGGGVLSHAVRPLFKRKIDSVGVQGRDPGAAEMFLGQRVLLGLFAPSAMMATFGLVAGVEGHMELATASRALADCVALLVRHGTFALVALGLFDDVIGFFLAQCLDVVLDLLAIAWVTEHAESSIVAVSESDGVR